MNISERKTLVGSEGYIALYLNGLASMSRRLGHDYDGLYWTMTPNTVDYELWLRKF